jgi:hypothetical protein
MSTYAQETIVFYGRSRSVLLSRSFVIDSLRDAIVTMTVDGDTATKSIRNEELADHRKSISAETTQRQIGFRSWRHKLNTQHHLSAHTPALVHRGWPR